MYKTELKGNRVINLIEEISRQSNVQTIRWLIIVAFCQILRTERKKTGQGNLNSIIFIPDCKICKGETEGVAEKISTIEGNFYVV